MTQPADETTAPADQGDAAPTQRTADASDAGAFTTDARDPADDERTPLPETPPPPGVYEAKAGSYFRNVRYGLFAALLLAGAWFLYDGFVKWPEDTRQYRTLQAQIDEAERDNDVERKAELSELQRDYKEHSDNDILLQKVLGLALPPIAVLLLARWLYISRGRLRLDESDTLHAPGHPPIPASAVTEVDDTTWDRKGISRVAYAAGGRTGRVKLDDFVYEAGPVRRIHDRLVHVIEQDAGGRAAGGPAV